ncbi:ABC transporter ATP-binding protein [Roseiconus nitratireducens]|uniref:ABC transporter ATP-binding protein n=1 Tax=Roseiconus nitratireducens TaxID=2605748 RepID=A0A5M6DBA0_9BACT|nr:ABC transporter ATP-binding protein [Roseiconus nitratireducens]KAA5543592.1 ABC transporter ATP-binding protein [Roseiconus nitratireducens]
MNLPVIQAERLEKSFDGQAVLDGLDLAIAPGQIVGLLGTNGSGKTTLIKCLLGLLRPTAGVCRVFGEDAWDMSPATKSRLGYVPQEAELLPWMTVQQMCDYTGAFYKHWRADDVQSLICQWQLSPDQRTGALSVGQRQKLGVILALGHHPDLLVLDEPVASLDPSARRQFLSTLIDRVEVEQNTILFSTHITSDLERIASHVAILRAGKLAWFGPLDELKDGCKRLRLYFADGAPTDLDLPGLVRWDRHQNHAVVTVASFDQGLLDALHRRWNCDVRVEDMNLEEIFLEWSGAAEVPSTVATEVGS